ncbi:MAG: M24 family metallopeptidase [Fimbriimonadales bacterium]
MTAVAYRSRIDKLAGALSTEGLDAFFATSPVTMGYLRGYFESGHERFLTLAIHSDGRMRLICPALSESQARRTGIEDIATWRDGENPLEHLERLANDWNLKSGILAVDDEMPAQMLLKMQATLPAALFKPGQVVLSRLMRNKDEQELALLRKAGRIADDAFDTALTQIHAGMTELQVEEILNGEMRRFGGKPAFCIVAAGAAGAEPHHLSDETVIKDGDVVVLDFGCDVEGGYKSDITRTICVGKASAEARKVYDIVYRSQAAGRGAARAGIAAQDVDRAARRVIEEAGYGEFFVHRTGHGIGMRGHEEPYMVEGNDELLEPGQCFSVEPGIYLPGRFGVRIENIVAATTDGHESLNREPSSTLIEV